MTSQALTGGRFHWRSALALLTSLSAQQLRADQVVFGAVLGRCAKDGSAWEVAGS